MIVYWNWGEKEKKKKKKDGENDYEWERDYYGVVFKLYRMISQSSL